MLWKFDICSNINPTLEEKFAFFNSKFLLIFVKCKFLLSMIFGETETIFVRMLMLHWSAGDLTTLGTWCLRHTT